MYQSLTFAVSRPTELARNGYGRLACVLMPWSAYEMESVMSAALKDPLSELNGREAVNALSCGSTMGVTRTGDVNVNGGTTVV